MQDDAMDIAGGLEAQVDPGLPAIDGFVEPVASRLAVTGVTLAGSHPDDVRRLLENGHGADGVGRLLVEDRRPINAT